MAENYTTETVFCQYSRHHCSRPRHQDFNYCLQHIVEDKESPFTSCQYVSRATKRKCPNPALKPKIEKITMPILCASHLQELLKKTNTRKKRKSKKRKSLGNLDSAQRSLLKYKNALALQVLKYGDHATSAASDSSDNDENQTGLSQEISPSSLIQLNGVDAIDSNDPIPSFDVLTDTEVLNITQQKLVRLQSLYIEQFKMLNYELREARREFVSAKNKVSREGDVAGSSQSNILSRYRQRNGIEALLRLRYNRKRLQKTRKTTTGILPMTIAPEMTSRCTHNEHHTRCKMISLPYTKFCSKHILGDQHQQLYTKCVWKECKTPVCLLTSFNSLLQEEGKHTEAYCQIHAPLPPLKFEMPKEILNLLEKKSKTSNEKHPGDICVDVEGLDGMECETKQEIADVKVEVPSVDEKTQSENKIENEKKLNNKEVIIEPEQKTVSVDKKVAMDVDVTSSNDVVEVDEKKENKIVTGHENEEIKPQSGEINLSHSDKTLKNKSKIKEDENNLPNLEKKENICSIGQAKSPEDHTQPKDIESKDMSTPSDAPKLPEVPHIAPIKTNNTPIKTGQLNKHFQSDILDNSNRKLSDEDIAVSSLLTLSAATHSESSDA